MKKIVFNIDCENNWKKEQHIVDCLTYVLENFDKVEPTIREFWLKDEMKKLERLKRKKENEFER